MRRDVAGDGDCDQGDAGDCGQNRGARPPAPCRRPQPERVACGCGELVAGLVAVVRVLRECGCDDAVDLVREVVLLGGEGGRRLLEVGEEESEVLLVAVGGSAGEAFVEDAAEGVDVGAAVDGVAADLLGRDVVDRAGELGFLASGAPARRGVRVRPKSAR